MRYLGVPDDDAVDVYKRSISKIRRRPIKERFVKATDQVCADSTRYLKAVTAGGLTTEPAFTLTDVTQSEMLSHYKNRFAHKNGPGHRVYNQIKVRARGWCPLCGPRTVGTLDHYLPKSPHTSLAVHPANLVPCCWECNNRKGDFQPSDRDGELLHPYFDNLGDDLWLDCEIVNVGGSPAFLFAPTRPASWSGETFRRVCHHFEFFDLGELYASQAANEFESIRHELAEVLTKDDAAGVRRHLERAARSRTSNEPNGWQAAMYRVMAASTEFHAGPFAK
jgi:5-methylcytosine-specific restriction endonuclease McrA